MTYIQSNSNRNQYFYIWLPQIDIIIKFFIYIHYQNYNNIIWYTKKSNYCLSIYHIYYKEKVVGISTQIFGFIAQLALVIKKREWMRIVIMWARDFLHDILHDWPPIPLISPVYTIPIRKVYNAHHIKNLSMYLLSI